MDIGYIWEKLYIAIRGLASSEQPLRTRLLDAHLTFHTLQVDDFPERFRSAFHDITAPLTQREPAGNEGSVVASVNAMTNEEVQQTIHSIVRLYDTICRSPELQARFPSE